MWFDMEQLELFKLEDLCRYLKIGRNTAYRLIKENKIPAFKTGRGWLIPKQKVVDYVCKEIKR